MKPLTTAQFVCYCATFAVVFMILSLDVTCFTIIALLLAHPVEEMARANHKKWEPVVFYGLLLVLFIQDWRYGVKFNIHILSVGNYVILFMLWLAMVFSSYRRWKKALTPAHELIEERPRSLAESIPPWNVDDW